MEFFREGIATMQTLVVLIGAGTFIGGLIELGRSASDNNPAARAIGFGMCGGGIMIFIVGVTLVPRLATFF